MTDVLGLVVVSRQLAEEVRRRETGLPPGRWPWRLDERIQIILHPQLLCCGCSQAVSTEWIIVVNQEESRQRVLAVFGGEEGRTIPLSEWAHPHVDRNGFICMGNSTDPVQALMLGFNPESAYGGGRAVRDFFAGLDHFCDGLNEDLITCYCCENVFEAEDDNISFRSGVDEYVCHRCEGSNLSWCDRCENYGWADDNHYWIEGNQQDVCEPCFLRHYGECEECNDKFINGELTSVRDATVCDRCLNRFERCGSCREMVHRDSCSHTEEHGWRCDACPPPQEEEEEEENGTETGTEN